MKNRTLWIMLLLIVSTIATAEKVYKSVDESGNVTYSSSPPENAVNSKSVTIPPGPTDEQKSEAGKRAESTAEQAEAMRQDRMEAQKQRAEAATPPSYRVVEQKETSGSSDVYWQPSRLPYVPIKDPNEGDRPVFRPSRPGKRPSIQPSPRPAGRRR
ncbi:MAG: DUF4124 domain-containing protein [Gammaproteobacteria bacterium]|nr:DUF4124 domain-containing protein [Gammaproteobacteria bacterium]